jgi:hypothetical protein
MMVSNPYSVRIHIFSFIHTPSRSLSSSSFLCLSLSYAIEEVTNPLRLQDPVSHYRFSLLQSCQNTHFYNSSLCSTLYSRLPACLESLQYAFESPVTPLKHALSAWQTCEDAITAEQTDRSRENVNVECNGTIEDCMPQMVWTTDFLKGEEVKAKLGVPEFVEWAPVREDVYKTFHDAGDECVFFWFLSDAEAN